MHVLGKTSMGCLTSKGTCQVPFAGEGGWYMRRPFSRLRHTHPKQKSKGYEACITKYNIAEYILHRHNALHISFF